jgi:hypothetical protein
LLVAEQLLQRDRALGAFETVVAADGRPWRQCPALLGDAFDLAAKRNLFGQQRRTRLAIFGALVRPARSAVRGKHLCRGQDRFDRHANLRFRIVANRFLDLDARESY